MIITMHFSQLQSSKLFFQSFLHWSHVSDPVFVEKNLTLAKRKLTLKFKA